MLFWSIVNVFILYYHELSVCSDLFLFHQPIDLCADPIIFFWVSLWLHPFQLKNNVWKYFHLSLLYSLHIWTVFSILLSIVDNDTTSQPRWLSCYTCIFTLVCIWFKKVAHFDRWLFESIVNSKAIIILHFFARFGYFKKPLIFFFCKWLDPIAGDRWKHLLNDRCGVSGSLGFPRFSCKCLLKLSVSIFLSRFPLLWYMIASS